MLYGFAMESVSIEFPFHLVNCFNLQRRVGLPCFRPYRQILPEVRSPNQTNRQPAPYFLPSNRKLCQQQKILLFCKVK
jgi:hypothetical protein